MQTQQRLFGGALAVMLLAAACFAGGIAAAADGGDHFGIPQVKFINEQIAAGWADAGMQPSAAATDGEWCRRVFLDCIGRIPTSEELGRFLADSSPAKKADLVTRLLGEDYVDEYARNWTDVWTTVLIGRDVENDNVNRSGMRQWLRRAFSKNMPYDQFMEALVTASGANANKDGVENSTARPTFSAARWRKAACRRPPRQHRFSWDCRCSARSATTILSIRASKTSFGNSVLFFARPGR
jgi:hypothetical protein